MISVALYEPEIPQNTGNIGRTCAATGAPLHIVGKPVFSMDESRVRRAGLDYWPYLDLHKHADLNAFVNTMPAETRILCLTTKTDRLYTDWEFREHDCIMFGPESRGLPEDVRKKFADTCLTIPMFQPQVRSLNLANSVAVVLYEAIRQLGYAAR